MGHGLLWAGFNAGVLLLLALDLAVSRREAGGTRARRAALWTSLWVAASLALCGGIYLSGNRAGAAQFLTGYLIEYALSVDNLFVFLLLFQAFHVPPKLQRGLLSWGVVGAFALRAALILGGVALVRRFEPVLYLFGAFLIVTAARMAFGGDAAEAEPGKNVALRLARRVLPLAEGEGHEKLLVRQGGRLRATDLFLVLIAIEATDLLFALDSIPAVLGVSRDPFIVYASNVCAVLGLRSLFSLVAGLMERLRYLRVALSGILLFIGVKMVVETWAGKQLPTLWTLGVVAAMLGLAVGVSLARQEPRRR